jgi:hypothetical protein
MACSNQRAHQDVCFSISFASEKIIKQCVEEKKIQISREASIWTFCIHVRRGLSCDHVSGYINDTMDGKDGIFCRDFLFIVLYSMIHRLPWISIPIDDRHDAIVPSFYIPPVSLVVVSNTCTYKCQHVYIYIYVCAIYGETTHNDSIECFGSKIRRVENIGK